MVYNMYMSWASLLNNGEDNSTLIKKKPVKNNNTDFDMYDESYYQNVNNQFDYEYGDKLRDNRYNFCYDNKYHNMLLNTIEPSTIYDFFQQFVNVEDYYKELEAEEEYSSDEDYDNDY